MSKQPVVKAMESEIAYTYQQAKGFIHKENDSEYFVVCFPPFTNPGNIALFTHLPSAVDHLKGGNYEGTKKQQGFITMVEVYYAP